MDSEEQGPPLNLTPVLQGVDTFFIIATTIIVLGRLYSRLIYKKNAGLDDAVALAAWVGYPRMNEHFHNRDRS